MERKRNGMKKSEESESSELPSLETLCEVYFESPKEERNSGKREGKGERKESGEREIKGKKST
jgi:hypothetical protein